MDSQALLLSFKLAGVTAALLLPIALIVARTLAWRAFRGRFVVEALLALPLVLPPSVLGFYLLIALSPQSWLGRTFAAIFQHSLAFSFNGLVLASLIANIPFAVQPMQRAFQAIDPQVREAAWLCGQSHWQTFWRVELPLAWPGVVSALALTIAHTLGEFGVVLMVGGNIPGETRTVAIAIYDRVQTLDNAAAGAMAAFLLGISLAAIAVVYALAEPGARRRG